MADRANMTRIAIREGNLEMFKSIVDTDETVLDAKDEDGKTMLIYAIDKNQPEITEMIIDTKADMDIDETDNFGNTALMYAVQRQSKRLVKKLIEKGADVNVEGWCIDKSDDYELHQTPLTIAVTLRNKGIVKTLIKAGCAVSYQKSEEMREFPLIVATRKDSVEIVRMLIEAGADVNETTKNSFRGLRWNSLMCAVYSNGPNSGEIIRMLLEAQADVTYRDSNKATAPMYFVKGSTNSASKMMSLLSAGADVNATDKFGWTPLMFAVRNDDIELVSLLLRWGANVNAVNNSGCTALMYSAEIPWADCPNLAHHAMYFSPFTELLLIAGSDISATDKSGQTALSRALKYGCYNSARSIVSAIMRRFDESDGYTGIPELFASSKPAQKSFLTEFVIPKYIEWARRNVEFREKVRKDIGETTSSYEASHPEKSSEDNVSIFRDFLTALNDMEEV